MKKPLSIFITIFIFWITPFYAQQFDDYFVDYTLRLDYIFTGDAQHQQVFLHEKVQLKGWWYGRQQKLYNTLENIPYQHLIILANTKMYSGSGILNAYTLIMTTNNQFTPVVVHEFGYSFASLADEYFYEFDVLNIVQIKNRAL